MWESSVQDLKLTESIAAEWKLSSQSKQINNPRPKIGPSATSATPELL